MLTKYHSGDQIEKVEGYFARTLGRRKTHIGFWCGNLRKRDQLKDLGVDGRILLKSIFKRMGTV
jgi:hypothetical protein